MFTSDLFCTADCSLCMHLFHPLYMEAFKHLHSVHKPCSCSARPIKDVFHGSQKTTCTVSMQGVKICAMQAPGWCHAMLHAALSM